jgi:hypothetical protein
MIDRLIFSSNKPVSTDMENHKPKTKKTVTKIYH